jgi:hypothetical protein
MSELAAWDRRTASLLEQAYLAAGEGPLGSGSGSSSEGDWRAKRQHLAVPMDSDGDWLDVGCANGHLLATLPRGPPSGASGSSLTASSCCPGWPSWRGRSIPTWPIASGPAR